MALEAPSWLNVDFTERILRLSEDDSTVQVINVFVKPATNKGDNYTSDMMRATIEFTRRQEDKTINEKKSLIFKFEPMVEGPRKDVIKELQIFDTEIVMMTDTLKKMNNMLGYENRLSTQIYHVRMERPLCLVMEDLAPLGFRMADRQAGLDLAHSMLAIQGLAKFHASSVALCEKEPKHKSLYRKGMYNEDYPEQLCEFFNNNCKVLADEIETWTELENAKIYAQKFRNFSSKLYSVGVEMIKRKDNEFNVINHGDCWVNNMLFKYDKNSKPIQHIFVDFQLCVYTSPAIDLHYFISTSTSEEVYDNHTEMLLTEYVRTLTKIMKQLNCKTQPPTFDELQKYMKDRVVQSLISSITILPIITVDEKEVVNFDEMMQTGKKFHNPGYKRKAYRRVLSKRIPKYDAMGLLD